MNQFFQQHRQLAEQAAKQTGLPVSVILAQWAHETGLGTSPLSRQNNLGGIKYYEGYTVPGGFNADGQHAGYTSLTAFLNDYTRVMNLSFYDHIRAMAKQGASPEQIIRGFTSSPPGVPRYAEDKAYSDKVIRILQQFDLAQLDTEQPATSTHLVAMQTGNSITLSPPAGATLPQIPTKALAAIGAVATAAILLAITRD